MITLDLAKRLRAAGVPWTPTPGDRFIVPDRDMDRDVFVISDIVVEVHELPTGRMLGFNGTTEWALDSIEQQEVLWLPREDQLREMLAGRFLRLESAVAGFVVVIDNGGYEQRHADGDAERAYARAVLAAAETDD